ncbi:hypothetical protein PanWU01x14_289480 [Parasponia andersonii]|uniref:Uncharacterized protein n=1 Tax=Parasponia andersonii TaxID=3476 RepID=A0A2P5AY16_PARAD|nr:hypothetical protein PanWU01x14_289480 [Parasponia andersonii]
MELGGMRPGDERDRPPPSTGCYQAPPIDSAKPPLGFFSHHPKHHCCRHQLAVIELRKWNWSRCRHSFTEETKKIRTKCRVLWPKELSLRETSPSEYLLFS